MKRIVQNDPTGCGIACVAMLSEKSYQKVKSELLESSKFSKKRTFYTDDNDLRKLSSKFGISLGRLRQFRTWSEIPDKSIVAINYKKNDEDPEWHWVVFRRINNEEFVFDPKKAIKKVKRTDFGRMKAKWYLKSNIA